MPRTTSLQRAQEALSDLGLILVTETRQYRGEVTGYVIYAASPAVITRVAEAGPQKCQYSSEQAGVTLVFDPDGKFEAANGGWLSWDEGYNDEPSGWEMRGMSTGTWRADYTTLKAALEDAERFSPVGIARAATEAQAAEEARLEALAKEHQDREALNQAVLDNVEAASWFAAIARETEYTQDSLVANLKRLAEDVERAVKTVESGEPLRTWHLSASRLEEVTNLAARLAGLRTVLDSPFEQALRHQAERYGYDLPRSGHSDL
jgi:hypothetical protein